MDNTSSTACSPLEHRRESVTRRSVEDRHLTSKALIAIDDDDVVRQIATGDAVAIPMLAKFPFVLKGIACAGAYATLIWFCVRNPQHRTTASALIACTILPYAWASLLNAPLILVTASITGPRVMPVI
jgi:hypothetical protein